MARRKKAKKDNGGPRVYSYIRFSHPDQQIGDSERRQIERAKRYADERRMPLDDTHRDRGLSGFHGHNRTKGALGRFLKEVEAGHVEPGSVLVVENVDRLGREDPWTALQTFGDMIRADITVVTLAPFAEYNTETTKEQPGLLHQLLGQMQMAHGESAKKADRHTENWKRKRESLAEGRPITRRRPNWLDIVEDDDGTLVDFTPIPERVAAVRMMFELRLDGLGAERLVHRLNTEAPWQPKRGWTRSTVMRTLKARTVIGEFQSHRVIGGRGGKRVPEGPPVEGYYPPIIDTDTFHAVQATFERNEDSGGRKDRCGNVFTRLVRCAYCGGSMAFRNPGSGPKGGKPRLVCDNGIRGTECERHKVVYEEFEETVLRNCRGLEVERVVPDADERAAERERLHRRVAGSETELADIESQIENCVDQITRTKRRSMRDRYEARVAKLEEKQVETRQRIDAAKRELAKVEHTEVTFEGWRESLAALSDAITGDDEDSVAARLRLREHIRGFVERIEVFAVGNAHPGAMTPTPPRTVTNTKGKKMPSARYAAWRRLGSSLADHIDDVVGEHAPELRKRKGYAAFLRHVTARRLSKDGRFFRIVLTTGAAFDVVPPGSLADGIEMTGPDSWKHVGPDIEELWEEFRSKHHDRKPDAGKPITTC